MRNYDFIFSMYEKMKKEDRKIKGLSKNLEKEIGGNPLYMLYFLNIGKKYETGGTEKSVYKDIFLKSLRKFENTFKQNKQLLDNIVDFEDELRKISKLKTKWAILEYKFKLEEVYFSKDDTSFYVIDNPLKKDKAFKTPYIAPSTWKGMIRWVAQKLYPNDKDAIIRIFGNKNNVEENPNKANIRIYPSFFFKIDLEVINPMDRLTRKGTNPIIYYEVVPKGEESKVIITYIPKFNQQEYFEKDLKIITHSIKTLIEVYGISAKRSSGWGKAKIIEENIKTGGE